MKNLLSASALSLVLVATHAQAGSLADPVIEAPIVVEEARSSSAGAAVPLLLLALVAIAVASNSGGGAAGGGASVSDARLKMDITQVGLTAMGLPLYQFRYIGGEAMFEGIMAQDVAKVMPQAVVPFKFGYMAVDYAKLGLELRQVK
jgi:hypothetical protein